MSHSLLSRGIYQRGKSVRICCPKQVPPAEGIVKVDSETYPVADNIALGWHTGIGREAASERWGFAFSAKKKWRDKVTADIAKVVETARGYAKAFYVSNQFIPDKKRAEVEDKLSKKYGIDVRILDRTWILDKVFTNGHEDLAIQDLQLGTSMRKDVRKGPLDTQREAHLKLVEERIQEELRSEHPGIQLAEDSIESADLARQLERSRVEVEGLYQRAEQLVSRYGTDHQRLKCAYQHAWTVYWWYEDFERFSELYEIAEQRGKDSKNAYDLELLTNLWSILHSAVIQGKLDEGRSGHAKRTSTLVKGLEELSRCEEQPSSVLYARALQLQIRLILNLGKKDVIPSILLEFKEVVRSCEGLAGFPFETLAEILIELGGPLGNLPEYDVLFEALVDVQTLRKKDLAAARMLLKRGTQQLNADQPYHAIRNLGLSLSSLYKDESRDDAVRALYLCGCAYERVGLLWAARGTLLSAASLATSTIWKYEEVTPYQAACYRRLKWLELQLGRIPQAISWHEVDIVVREILVKKGTVKADVDSEVAFDATLGILLLRTDFWELKWLSSFPDVLDNRGLFSASMALKYALGYEDELREGLFQENDTEKEMSAFFLKWRDQPASKELPTAPALYEEQKITLESQLLGCRIKVESENVSPCVELAESILSAFESLLSTGTVEPMIAREPILTAAVRTSDFAKTPFEFDLQDQTGRPHIDITCSMFDPHTMSGALQEAYKETLFKLLATIVARIIVTNDMEQALTKLFRDEKALERSVNFTGSFVTVGNVLGSDPKTRISRWSNPNAREYPLRRQKAWDAAEPRFDKPFYAEAKPISIGKGEPPKELRSRDQIRQSDIQTVSLIREVLWDKAKWTGTLFAWGADDDSPPILSLAFRDPASAKQIFEFWRSELGVDDTAERLRIAIVRGISKAHPSWYRVLIGSNPLTGLSGDKVRFAAFHSRIHTMHPNSSINLEGFLRRYYHFNCYFFTPAIWKDEASKPEILLDSYLSKRELHVRQAWEIGRHDLDGPAIHADDEPVIPAEQVNSPVLELLEQKKHSVQRKSGTLNPEP